MTDWADPEIEMAVADGLEPGAWTCVAGMLEGGSAILDAWEDWQAQVEEYRALDDERILVLTRRVARGKTSGLRVPSKGANLFHLRAGVVIGIVHFWDRERAFADLDLDPEGDARESDAPVGTERRALGSSSMKSGMPAVWTPTEDVGCRRGAGFGDRRGWSRRRWRGVTVGCP